MTTCTRRRLPLRLLNLEGRITPAVPLMGPLAPNASLWTSVGRAAGDEPSLYRIDHDALSTSWAAARLATPNAPALVTLPAPGGAMRTFEVWGTAPMHPDLAARYPDIRTYHGRAVDDPTAMLVADLSPGGFHAYTLDDSGWTITPASAQEPDVYVARPGASAPNHGGGCACELCQTAARIGQPPRTTPAVEPFFTNGQFLKTYRMAVATTGEYTAAVGGTVANAQTAITTLVNYANAVYERDLAIRFQLVANNDTLIYTNASTDPYSGNIGAHLGQNQANLTATIGGANYDVGHVLTNLGGGIASVGVIGFSAFKAQGASGNLNFSAIFGINLQHMLTFVHEVGHQFGANHTFNTLFTVFGSEQRNGPTAWEIGAGATIMSYGGFGVDDYVTQASPFFHNGSIEEILTHLASVGTVGTKTATGNTPPSVSGPLDQTIPARTPFVLNGSGSDANGDSLTYTWEQMDLGPTTLFTDPDNGTSPLFRWFAPSTKTERQFPNATSLRHNDTSDGEVLPSTNRSLNFRFTARDSRPGGGGVATDDVKLTVIDTGAPFKVTSPNTAVGWQIGSKQTITWDVAGTNAAQFGNGFVTITLSLDGGLTYPITIASVTPNDGSETITVPNNATNTARLKIQGNARIWFDINDSNFTIGAGGSISGTTYSDANQDGGQDSFEKGFSGRTVYLDANNNGRFDAGRPLTFTSANVPVPINSLATVSVPISVNVNGNVADVDVTLDITHPFTQDLDIYLVHPSGQRVELVTDVAGKNFTGTIFDDQAATSITAGAAPFTGRFRPEGLLTDFQDLALNGTWLLEITDDFSADDGVLNSVTLTLGRAFPISPAAAITDLATTKSTINVSGLNGVTADVDVSLFISHGRTSDLDVYLTGPNGTKVALTTDNGGTGKNYTFTIFDDEAPTAITAGVAPFTGRFRPEGPLSAFDNISPNGAWLLEVFDDTAGTTGTLDGWTLFLNRDFAPADTKSTISDGSTISRTITVDGLLGPILDVDVSLDITQPLAPDLDVYLTAPGGTKIELFTDVSSSGSNFYGLILDDEAAPSINAAAAPFSARFRPEGDLVDFDGLDGNGVWTLQITDDTANGFAGTLDHWSITFRTAYTTTSTVVTPIPDLGSTSSQIIVQNVPDLISDVNVTVNISHTWDEDLDVVLVAPGGTQVKLFSDVGGSGDNFTNTVLDDEAFTAIAAGSAPFTASYRPEQKLSLLDGLNPNGIWQLLLADDESLFTGTLNSWSLTFTTGERHAMSNALGSYSIDNLAAGTYRVREQTPAGYRPTEPDPNAYYLVTLGAGGGLGGRDFGSIADTTPPTATVIPVSPNPRNTAVGSVQIVFSERVSGLDLSDLHLDRDIGPNLLTAAQTLSSSNNGQSYSLNNLAPITGAAGLYFLEVKATLGTLILDRAGNAMQVSGYTAWVTDLKAPNVTTLNRLNPDPTGAATVTWRLTTNEQVVGLTQANFALVANDITGAAITAVTYNAALNGWEITASTGTGVGTLGLNLVNNTNATDLAGNPLANVPFTGQAYSVDRTPAQVTQVTVNNPPTSSRSRVTSLTVAFDSVVTFAGPPVSAFTLTRSGPGAPMGPVGLSAAVVSSGVTLVTLSFTDTTEGGSLIDGKYDLVVNASKVSDLGGQMTSNYAFNFHRLFGDTDGDGDNDTTDFGAFRSAFGGSNPAFDFDNDGDVDTSDFGQFRQRYGVSI